MVHLEVPMCTCCILKFCEDHGGGKQSWVEGKFCQMQNVSIDNADEEAVEEKFIKAADQITVYPHLQVEFTGLELQKKLPN